MELIISTDNIEKYIKEKITKFYKSKKLYPFLGSGFTKGAKTRRHHVLDGHECINKMKELITSYNKSLSAELDSIVDFDLIADLFYQFVPKEEIKNFISNYFTNVTLADYSLEFARHRWPVIYTLNIDDGIERANGYNKVLPNKRIDKRYLNFAVIKLHGDSNDELLYLKAKDGIIFSRKQYLKSLNDNKDLLNLFLEDFNGKNLLFIGCSLNNEIDLEYILSNDSIRSNSFSEKMHTDKIYVSTKQPTELEKIRLANFGINIYLKIESYKDFYLFLNESLNEIQFSDEDILNPFLINKIETSSSLEFNKQIITGSENVLIRNNCATVPIFFFQRTKTKEIVEKLKKTQLLFVIGKRVSGKSFIALNLAQSLQNEKIYYFPSKFSIDSKILETLKEREDEVFIFDTDTLSAWDMEDIYYLSSEFEKRRLKFIFIINSSDRLMLSIPYTKIMDAEIIEIENKLDKEELLNINEGLSKIGLAKFKRENNIFTNIVWYKNTYNSNFQFEISKIIQSLTPDTLPIYILNASFEKVYSSVYRALGVDYDNIKLAVEASGRAIEFEFDLSTIESYQHSNYKVITNSKVFLFYVLGEYIQQVGQNLKIASATLVKIVSVLKNYDRFNTYWKGLIAFDTLNQIFYKKGIDGSIRLIFSVYENLETLLYQESHYWMQRAKSIFYLKRNDVFFLRTAVDYTKKAHFDAPPNSRIKINSSFQIALIYNRIVVNQNFTNIPDLNECVNWMSLALQEISNSRVLTNFIEEAKHAKRNNDFYQLSTFLFDHGNLVDPKKRQHLLSYIFQNFKNI